MDRKVAATLPRGRIHYDMPENFASELNHQGKEPRGRFATVERELRDSSSHPFRPGDLLNSCYPTDLIFVLPRPAHPCGGNLAEMEHKLSRIRVIMPETNPSYRARK